MNHIISLVHRLGLLVLVFCLFFIQVSVSYALSFSLDPSLTRTFFTIEEIDGTNDIGLRFGAGLSEWLLFNRSSDRFELTNDLQISGDLELTGNLTAPNLMASQSATSGSVLVSRTSGDAVWRLPRSTMIWYVDGTVATGAGQSATVTMPYGFTVTDIDLKVDTAPTGASLIIDINEGGSTLFSTRPEIDAGSTTEDDSEEWGDVSLAAGAEITLDIDQVGSTVAGADLTVMLHGYRHY